MAGDQSKLKKEIAEHLIKMRDAAKFVSATAAAFQKRVMEASVAVDRAKDDAFDAVAEALGAVVGEKTALLNDVKAVESACKLMEKAMAELKKAAATAKK